MEIKDIINREVFHITNCENEPIHIPGSIQPHGALIAITADTFIVKYCSANTTSFIGREPREILGNPLSAILTAEWPGLQPYLESKNFSTSPFPLAYHDKSMDVIIHHTGEYFLLEMEESSPQMADASRLYDQTRSFVSFIERSGSLQELCQCIADETRRQTGYDRVMIYRFDKEYNGEVFAESRNENIEPYLGLQYPHTDIPPQARELYLRNLLRMIVDVNYEPVPLLTIADKEPQQLDLSDAGLRSVSPIHIQYLKNMGVGATLTISLLLDGKLWGLIACHHYAAKKLSYTERQSAILQGYFLTSQIKVQQVAEEYKVNTIVEAHLQQLLNAIKIDEDFSMKFDHFTSLLAVTNASGVVILHNGEYFEKGKVPPREKTKALIHWLADSVKSVQMSTSFLSNRYPDGEDISNTAAGIIYHTLGKPKENCIIWFREEKEKTVKWAGNPKEAVLKNNQENLLMPRSSFAIWKERVRHHSLDWRLSEVNAATRFATSLQNYFHLNHLRNEEYKQRMMNEKLIKANEELANINWITTHDLKEPLRKIQLFSSRIITTEGENLSQLFLSSITRINQSAKRMQNLVDDILAYSLLDNKENKFELTDMSRLVNEVLEDFDEDIREKNIQFVVDKLPEVKIVPYQVRQLFTNLFGNAIKFASKDRSLVINISCAKMKGQDAKAILAAEKYFYEITVADNGIGFSPEYNRRLFNVFYRLHDKEAYTGTGIGLAICKKIMNNHNGDIVAEGKSGEGAVFTCYFPVS